MLLFNFLGAICITAGCPASCSQRSAAEILASISWCNFCYFACLGADVQERPEGDSYVLHCLLQEQIKAGNQSFESSRYMSLPHLSHMDK